MSGGNVEIGESPGEISGYRLEWMRKSQTMNNIELEVPEENLNQASKLMLWKFIKPVDWRIT